MPRREFAPTCDPAGPAEGRRRLVIELYCGSCSFAHFMRSQLRWSAWYICIDRLPRQELERKYQAWGLKAFLDQPFVVYIQRNLGNLSPEKLELWCQAFAGECTVEDIIALHASFDCTTLSQAGACNDAEVRTAGGGAVSLAAQYDSQHLRRLCDTLRYV